MPGQHRVSNPQRMLYGLIDHLAQACKEFGLKKMNAMNRDEQGVSLSIGDHTLEVVGDLRRAGPPVCGYALVPTKQIFSYR